MERLSAKAIREGKNLAGIVIEILEAVAKWLSGLRHGARSDQKGDDMAADQPAGTDLAQSTSFFIQNYEKSQAEQVSLQRFYVFQAAS